MKGGNFVDPKHTLGDIIKVDPKKCGVSEDWIDLA
jgi:hypothetical protein